MLEKQPAEQCTCGHCSACWVTAVEALASDFHRQRISKPARTVCIQKVIAKSNEYKQLVTQTATGKKTYKKATAVGEPAGNELRLMEIKWTKTLSLKQKTVHEAKKRSAPQLDSTAKIFQHLSPANRYKRTQTHAEFNKHLQGVPPCAI